MGSFVLVLREHFMGGKDVGPNIYQCNHRYSTEILSIDPLVLYINNFVSQYEVEELSRLRFVKLSLTYPSIISERMNNHDTYI